jgi:hypothetical protein
MIPKFKVICDSTNNSEEDIAEGRLNVAIVPVYDYLEIVFSITPQNQVEFPSDDESSNP